MPALPKFMRNIMPRGPRLIRKVAPKDMRNNVRVTPKNEHKDVRSTGKNVRDNVKNTNKNLDRPQQVIFEPCENEKMHKGLLENEKLIKQVLSKYPELKSITIGVDDKKSSAYASSSGIYLDSNWFKEDDNVKQFILAHEAAHITCKHTGFSIIKTLVRLKNFVLTNLSYGAICLGVVGSAWSYKTTGLKVHKNWIIPISSLMFGIKGLSMVNKSLESHRQNERQADLMGVERLGTAEGGIKFFEKYDCMFIDLVLKIIGSTHPTPSERVAYLQAWQSKHKNSKAKYGGIHE